MADKVAIPPPLVSSALSQTNGCASAPSASSAAGCVTGCQRRFRRTWPGFVVADGADGADDILERRTILITLVPGRPSRLNAMSMPRTRRNVCARRRQPASARGFFGQAAAPLGRPGPARAAPARRRSEALPVHVRRFATICRTQAATGSASIRSSIAALRFA
jgi:hypothetical protein